VVYHSPSPLPDDDGRFLPDRSHLRSSHVVWFGSVSRTHRFNARRTGRGPDVFVQTQFASILWTVRSIQLRAEPVAGTFNALVHSPTVASPSSVLRFTVTVPLPVGRTTRVRCKTGRCSPTRTGYRHLPSAGDHHTAYPHLAAWTFYHGRQLDYRVFPHTLQGSRYSVCGGRLFILGRSGWVGLVWFATTGRLYGAGGSTRRLPAWLPGDTTTPYRAASINHE